MVFSCRRTVVLRILTGVIAILAIGLWCRYEFLVKPIETQRAARIAYYKDFSAGLRGYARTYAQIYSSDQEFPDAPRQQRQMLAWADWFDDRARHLETASGYQQDQEKRVYAAFQSANPGVESWTEPIFKSW